MILNGVDIIQMGIMNIKDLKFDHILMIYIPNMWTNDLDYQRTLVEANHYYETSPYVAKKNQKNPKRGTYKSVSHGYVAHGGAKSKGNVIKYNNKKIPNSIQRSLKGLGDSIASSIWMQLDKFGSQVQQFFNDQVAPMDCISIGLDGYATKVQQMHISKNSYIKPYLDKYDMEASFIAWFISGDPKGGCFGLFQHCLKFDTNLGTGAFVRSKTVAHGTLRFIHKTLAENVYKVGVALVNKQVLTTRIKNQLRDGAPMTWQSNDFSSDCDSDNNDD